MILADSHGHFLRAIRNDPLSSAPRLIYADWLEEHGDPAQAELIRVQCGLAAEENKQLHQQLQQRERELTKNWPRHAKEPEPLWQFSKWQPDGFPVLKNIRWLPYDRGLPYGFRSDAKQTRQNDLKVALQHCCEWVLQLNGPYRPLRYSRSLNLESLRTLVLVRFAHWPPNCAVARRLAANLAANPSLQNLHELTVPLSCAHSFQDCQLPNLRTLTIVPDAEMPSLGKPVLLKLPSLQNVDVLCLHKIRLKHASLKWLVSRPVFAGLRALAIHGADLRRADFEILAASAPQLELLDIRSFHGDVEELSPILDAGRLPMLRRLAITKSRLRKSHRAMLRERFGNEGARMPWPDLGPYYYPQHDIRKLWGRVARHWLGD